VRVLTDGHTDRHTDTLTDANRLYNLSQRCKRDVAVRDREETKTETFQNFLETEIETKTFRTETETFFDTLHTEVYV